MYKYMESSVLIDWDFFFLTKTTLFTFVSPKIMKKDSNEISDSLEGVINSLSLAVRGKILFS